MSFMGAENLIEPLAVLIIYIVPGYISIFTFLSISKMFTPTIKYSWEKIQNFDKIIFSLIISTLIYCLSSKGQDNTILNIFEISSEEQIVVMGISLFFAMGFAVCLYMLVISITKIFVPYYDLLDILIKKLILRKDLNKILRDDFFNSRPFGLGTIYDLKLVQIERAYRQGIEIELKLKSTNELKKGKIVLIKNDYSEFGLKEDGKITTIESNDIIYLSFKEDTKKLRKDEIRNLKYMTCMLLVSSIILIILYEYLFDEFNWIYLLVPVVFIVIIYILGKLEKEIS